MKNLKACLCEGKNWGCLLESFALILGVNE